MFATSVKSDPDLLRSILEKSGNVTMTRVSPSAPTNAVLHVPAHKQTRPAALPAQIVDTEWHALARIAA